MSGGLPSSGADVLVEGDVETRGRLVILNHVKQSGCTLSNNNKKKKTDKKVGGRQQPLSREHLKTIKKINIHFIAPKPVRVVNQEEPVCSDIDPTIQCNNTTGERTGGTFLHL